MLSVEASQLEAVSHGTRLGIEEKTGREDFDVVMDRHFLRKSGFFLTLGTMFISYRCSSLPCDILYFLSGALVDSDCVVHALSGLLALNDISLSLLV